MKYQYYCEDSKVRTEFQFSNSIGKTHHLWRNDITGLRALAVIPVLLYHAFPELMPGGYFGVDVFFVISGYLISGIIFRSLQAENFSYLDFYEKRIKRIVPNLVLLMCFVGVLGWFFLFSSEFSNLAKHIISSSFFIQNFNLLSESGYFTEDALRKPLLHLWSLAIEEQFYIFFPIMASLIWKYSHSVKLIGATVIFITVGSFIGCILTSDMSVRFYFPLTRFWEIGLGILIAFIEAFAIFRFTQLAQSFRNIISILSGLVIIVLFVVARDVEHPGWVTLVPVICASFIIIAGPNALLNKTLLAWKPMTFFGVISYSLYLWHWPLLAYLFICVPQPAWYWKVGALVLSVCVSTLVYFFVENPLRRKKWQVSARWLPSAIILLPVISVVIVSGYVLHRDGVPERDFQQRFSHMENIRQWVNWKGENRIKYQGATIFVDKANDIPEILLAGDSHAEMYWPRLKVLGRDASKSTGIFWSSGCFVFGSYSSSKACEKAQKDFYKILNTGKVRRVVIVNKWGGRLWLKDKFSEALTSLLNYTTERNIKLFVILDAPWDEGPRGSQGSFDPLKHFNRFEDSTQHLSAPPPKDERWINGNLEVLKVFSGSKAIVIDPYPYVCPDNQCNLNIWRDDDHLRPMWLLNNSSWFDQVIK